MTKSFLVVYEKGKRNYSGFAPDVAGCGSMGNTLDEMRANLREALELYMETSAEFGYELPEPKTTQVTLPTEGETDLKTTYVVEHLTIRFKTSRGKPTPGARPARTRIPTKRRALTAA